MGRVFFLYAIDFPYASGFFFERAAMERESEEKIGKKIEGYTWI